MEGNWPWGFAATPNRLIQFRVFYSTQCLIRAMVVSQASLRGPIPAESHAFLGQSIRSNDHATIWVTRPQIRCTDTHTHATSHATNHATNGTSHDGLDIVGSERPRAGFAISQLNHIAWPISYDASLVFRKITQLVRNRRTSQGNNRLTGEPASVAAPGVGVFFGFGRNLPKNRNGDQQKLVIK